MFGVSGACVAFMRAMFVIPDQQTLYLELLKQQE